MFSAIMVRRGVAHLRCYVTAVTLLVRSRRWRRRRLASVL